jgi:hypothetical protein
MEFNWRPGIGDPTIGGWLTVALYLIAAAFSWRASMRETAQSERRIWRFVAIVFVGLGINKQLDLQSAFTELGRIAAVNNGWYDRRHDVQVSFIKFVAALCAAMAIGLLICSRSVSSSCRIAILGTVIVAGFVLVRASSFHRVDILINNTGLGIRWNWILEMGGILFVILAAVWPHRLSKK